MQNGDNKTVSDSYFLRLHHPKLQRSISPVPLRKLLSFLLSGDLATPEWTPLSAAPPRPLRFKSPLLNATPCGSSPGAAPSGGTGSSDDRKCSAERGLGFPSGLAAVPSFQLWAPGGLCVSGPRPQLAGPLRGVRTGSILAWKRLCVFWGFRHRTSTKKRLQSHSLYYSYI